MRGSRLDGRPALLRAPPIKFEIFAEILENGSEMARTHRQKAIRRLLSRFRWSPRGRIFDRFEPGSLSTFFQKSDRQ